MKNKKRIIIECPYTMYEEEWEELNLMLNGLLSGTKFSCCEANIENI